MITKLVVLALAWGALAFGAVYPWGFLPLGAVLLGIAAWQWRPSRPTGVVPWAALLLVAAVAIQLVPLSAGTLERVSPAAFRLVSSLDVAFANGVTTRHPLSLNPGGTALALGALLLAMIWVPTCAAILQRPGALHRLARHVVVLGTVVALIGLAHKATYNGKVLWVWTPEFFATNSFGPFVNRNHFAGWMLLVLPIAVGLLFARTHRGGVPSAARLRDRVLWLGSPQAAQLLLTTAAAVVMACSLLWTMSRSGIASAGVAMGIMCAAALRQSSTAAQRWVAGGSLAAAIAGVVSWRGTETLLDWYGKTATLQWRIQLWKDTWPALEDFWMTGAGLNTYARLMLVHPRTDMQTLPRAAHNDYLQLALEGGLLVGIPALLLAAAIIREIVRALKAPQDETTWWIRMGAVAGICGMAVQEISEFSLQVPGVFLLFVTLLAVALHPPAPAVGVRHARDLRHAPSSRAVSAPVPAGRVARTRLATAVRLGNT